MRQFKQISARRKALILHTIYLCQSAMSSALIFHFLMHNIYCNFSWYGKGEGVFLRMPKRSGREGFSKPAVEGYRPDVRGHGGCFRDQRCPSLGTLVVTLHELHPRQQRKIFLRLWKTHKKDISEAPNLCTKCCANCFLFNLSCSSSSFRPWLF